MQYKALAIYTIIPTNDHFVPILEVSADPSNDGNSKSQMSSPNWPEPNRRSGSRFGQSSQKTGPNRTLAALGQRSLALPPQNAKGAVCFAPVNGLLDRTPCSGAASAKGNQVGNLRTQ